MRQRWLVAAALVAGCGTEPDPREPTSEVVVYEILQPNCAQAQCHSQATQSGRYGYAFDSIERTAISIDRMGGGSVLLGSVTGLDPNVERMPFDAPLHQEDIELIRAWILINNL